MRATTLRYTPVNDEGAELINSDRATITVVDIRPAEPLHDYQAAIRLAKEAADNRLGPNMLLSWYDRDRDFESPQHASECHLDGATPGYVDYGVNHGATLKIDVEDGRFVFFYLPIDF